MEGPANGGVHGTDEREANKLPQIAAALGATLGSFGLGNALSWSAVALPHMEFPACNGTDNINRTIGCSPSNLLSSEQASWVASIMTLGALVAGPVAGILMQKLGKKFSMIILAFPFILGWLLLAFSHGFIMLLLGRLLTGFSGGAFALVAPGYTSEIAENSIRGALGSMMQLMTTLGILLIYVLASFLEWSTISTICAVLPATLIVWMMFMPDSPVYLVSVQRTEDAKKALKFLRGSHVDVEKELSMIQDGMDEAMRIGTVSFCSFFTVKAYFKPLFISLVLMFLQQFSGINAVLFYTVQIFEQAGTAMDANMASIYVASVQVAGTAMAVFIVDKFGRRLLLLLSDIFMALAILGLGGYFHLKEQLVKNACEGRLNCTTNAYGVTEEMMKTIGLLPVIALMLYIAAFSIGFGPIPWMMNAELFSPEAKARAAAICYMFNWLCGFLVTKFYPTALEYIDMSTAYFFFGGICVLGTMFVGIVVPETRGMSPEDMREYFRDKSSD